MSQEDNTQVMKSENLIQALHAVNEVQNIGDGSSLIIDQGLISSGNNPRDIPRANVFPETWAFCSPVKFAHKIDHHNWILAEGTRVDRNETKYCLNSVAKTLKDLI